MTATDNFTPNPNITCTGGFTGGSLTYSAGVNATFPVGSTTVSCYATDGAGLRSTTRTFVVTVSCASGYSQAGSTCTGELARGEGGVPRA
jgi:hypothetical protein